MTKLLLLLAVAGLAWWWLRRRLRRDDGSPRKAAKARPPAGPGQAPSAGAIRMIACAHCGVHLPEADALTDAAGRAYCGEAHRLAGPR